MKIVSGNIFGFAKWVDFEFDISSNDFTVIYGENESGKSSLHQFFLFILFGMPPKMRAFYRPKTSSKMGGRITISDPTIGEFTVERLDDTRNGAAICYTPDGQVYDEEWLKAYLSGMTQDSYKAIFSFSALDLVNIRSMKEEDIGEVLLGIGLTGSSHIYAIERKLDTKLAGLFKPYGTKPLINQHVNQLSEQYKEMIHKQQEEATYRDQKQELVERTAMLGERVESIRHAKEKILLFEKQLQALPSLNEYQIYKNNLASLPDDLSFPTNGIERLQVLKEKLIPIQSELAILTSNEKKYLDDLSQYKDSLTKKLPYEPCNRILERATIFHELRKEQKKLHDEVEKLDNRIAANLHELNIGLHPKGLEQLTIPFHLERTWTDLKNKKQQLTLEQEQLAEEKQLIATNQSFVEKQLHDIESEILPSSKRKKLEDQRNDHNEKRVLQKLQQEHIERRNKWEKTKRNRMKKGKKYFALLICMSILFGVFAFFMESVPLTVIPVVLLLIGVGQLGWNNKSIRDMDAFFEQETNLSQRNHDLEINIDEVDRMLELDDEIKNEQQLLFEQLKKLDTQKIHLEEKLAIKREQEAQLQKSIKQQIASYPFLSRLDLVYWPELYHSLKEILRLQQEKRSLDKEVTETTNKMDLFMEDVNQFFVNENYEPIPRNIEQQLITIEDNINEEKEIQQSIAHINEMLAENREQQEVLREKVNNYQQEMKELYHHAGVEHEEGYYTIAKQIQQRDQWKLEKDRIYTQFSSVFSQEEWTNLLQEMPNQKTLELELQHIKGIINEQEQEMDELRQQIATIQTKIKNMEASEDYSHANHRFQMEKEQLHGLSKEWATYKVAKELLANTKRHYRNKYMKKVIEQTTNYFSKITGGTYSTVYPPIDGNPFTVEHHEKIRYTVNELSQGTIDQLYISLRIAIAEILTEEKQFPFIIDDAFVHFDAVRTERVLKILKDIAKKQQVILFSCRREIIHSLPSHVIKLENLVP